MARGRRDLDLERQWRDRMSQWRASGLSVRDFCQRQGGTDGRFGPLVLLRYNLASSGCLASCTSQTVRLSGQFASAELL